jgi:hypothetical protein
VINEQAKLSFHTRDGDPRENYFDTVHDAELAAELLRQHSEVNGIAVTILRSINGVSIEPGFLALIDLAIKSNMRVLAIKAMREKTGLGLKEAKDVTDARAEMHKREESQNTYPSLGALLRNKLKPEDI